MQFRRRENRRIKTELSDSGIDVAMRTPQGICWQTSIVPRSLPVMIAMRWIDNLPIQFAFLNGVISLSNESCRSLAFIMVAAFDMVNGSGTMCRCLFSVIVGGCCSSSIIQMHVTFVVWCQYCYSTKKRNARHVFPSACHCVAFRKCCIYYIQKTVP